MESDVESLTGPDPKMSSRSTTLGVILFGLLLATIYLYKESRMNLPIIQGNYIAPHPDFTTNILIKDSVTAATAVSRLPSDTPPPRSPDTFDRLRAWNSTRPESSIIINTYMRSGSSLTGNIFGHNPNVFYVFEPMYTLKWLWLSKKVSVNYFDRGQRLLNDMSQFAEAATRTARGFLECRFTDIDISTLTQFHLGDSPDTKPFHICVRKNPGVLNITKCLPILYKACSKAKLSAIKTIRFPMSAVEDMMNTSQSLKVIHLLRDPRATIRSQIEAGRSTWSALNSYSKAHCDRVWDDLQATQRLLVTEPRRAKLVLYEELSRDPLNTTKELYSFSGLQYSNETERYVLSVTSSKKNSCHTMYCTSSANSTKESFQWRKDIAYKYAKIIDKNCKHVYDKLGYMPVEDEEHLLDFSRPLFVHKDILARNR